MAPRLSRWIAMTAVGAVLVAVLFLTTGGDPLLYMGYGELMWDVGAPTPYQQRYNGLRASLEHVQRQREALELRILLADALRRTSADPVVFRRSGNTLSVDPTLTAELQPLWTALPHRRPEFRTVAVIELGQPAWRWGMAGIDSTELCIVDRMGTNWIKDFSRAIRSMAGECLFAESFGAPGAGMSKWMTGVRRGLNWEHVGRIWGVPWIEDGERNAAPVWYEHWAYDYTYGWRNRPVGQAEMACLVGRDAQCELATGVGPGGWPGWGPSGYIQHNLPNAALPYDLMTALGPDRFGQIWTSADPIAISYQRVTGTSMGEWLGEWARRYAGPIERDNGLSLTGWVGTLLWLSLLGLLTAGRLKQRAVT